MGLREHDSDNKAKRVALFYFFCILTNLGVFAYEILLVRMSIGQSLVIRTVTLVTDFGEAILFLGSNRLDWGASFVIELLPFTPHPSLKNGLKLALIGPNIYFLKLLFCNLLVIPLFGHIARLGWDKIWLAYAISCLLSFTTGTAYSLFIENALGRLFRAAKRLIGKA